jgi:hypothetical protein
MIVLQVVRLREGREEAVSVRMVLRVHRLLAYRMREGLGSLRE